MTGIHIEFHSPKSSRFDFSAPSLALSLSLALPLSLDSCNSFNIAAAARISRSRVEPGQTLSFCPPIFLFLCPPFSVLRFK